MENINIFNISISSYIFFIFIAFFSGLLLIIKLEKNKEKDSVILLYLINIIGFIFGAKLSYFLEHDFINFADSGYSFSGGLIGSILVLFIYSKISHINLNFVLNNYTVIYPLIYGIAKIGCYFGGCCSGQIIGSKCPLQIFESIIMISLCLILLRKKYKIDYFFLLFGIFKFIIDYFRYNRNLIFYSITFTQIICFLFVIISVVNLIRNKNVFNT